MGLQSDARGGDKKKAAPIADYVRDHQDGEHWATWLQDHRYELNAMTMPQFVGWLDDKMAEHGVEKVIPPTDYVLDDLETDVKSAIRAEITSDVLAKAGIDDLVRNAVAEVDFPDHGEIEEELPEWLDNNPTDRWKGWVEETVTKITGGRT